MFAKTGWQGYSSAADRFLHTATFGADAMLARQCSHQPLKSAAEISFRTLPWIPRAILATQVLRYVISRAVFIRIIETERKVPRLNRFCLSYSKLPGGIYARALFPFLVKDRCYAEF